MNLQEMIVATEPFGVLELKFNEYVGQIVIRKPITIIGAGSTVCAKRGPVVRVLSKDVVIRDLRIEITTDLEDRKGESSLAVFVDPQVRAVFQDVVVRGDASGIILEDGEWYYPESLNIWPVVPEKKNYFSFDLNVPVSCSLETDIDGLEILNPGIREPGRRTIRLEVNRIHKDIILFGEITIRSASLSRVIAVSGGTFGVSENQKPSPPKKPLKLDGTGAEAGIPRREGKRKFRTAAAVAVIILIALIAAGLASFLFRFVSTENEKTEHPPHLSGAIEILNESYAVGDPVGYRISASSENRLKKIRFEVLETNISEDWEPDRTQVDLSSSFSTKFLKEGVYTCSLVIQDVTGAKSVYEDSVTLKKVVIGKGFLNLYTEPYAEIFINGKAFGETPKGRIELEAGDYEVRFLNRKANIDAVRSITVKAGETAKKRFIFRSK